IGLMVWTRSVGTLYGYGLMLIMPQEIGCILWMAKSRLESCPSMVLSMRILKNRNRSPRKNFTPISRKDGRTTRTQEAESHHTQVRGRLADSQMYSPLANG